MSTKSWIVMAAVLTTLSACGTSANNQTALPGDGSVPTAMPSDSNYAMGMDPTALTSPDPYGGGSLGSGGFTSGSSPNPYASASPATGGYTLKGIVTDQAGAPLSGAKVSIGAQTTIASAQGTFEIDKIMDSQIAVTVTMDGYQSISSYTVHFSASSTVADKEFKLAPSGSTSTGNSNTPAPSNGGFTLNASFSPKTFTSVSALAVDGDTAYVLGVVEHLLIDRNSVCEINARTGEEITTFSKTGFLSWLPKSADSLYLNGGQLNVTDGKHTYTFASTGSLLQKSSGGVRKPNPQTVTDTTRNITYTLRGATKCEVHTASADTTFTLPDAQGAIGVGLDSDGDLLVLDSSRKALLQYTFKP